MTSVANVLNVQPTVQLTDKQRRGVITGIFLGLFLGALDQTIVATAGPAIQRDLSIPPSMYALMTTVYIVASTVASPLYGKLFDRNGRKPVLLVGMLIFIIGSALCGFSTNTQTLIIFRAIQGLGAAALFSGAFTVVADLFAPQERARVGGFLSGIFGVASVLGPLLGGIITDKLSWKWVFFLNIPIGILAIAFIGRQMPDVRPKHMQSRAPLDLLGALLLILTMSPLLAALTLGRSSVQPGGAGLLWSSPVIQGLLGLTAVGLVGFVLAERKAKDPIVFFPIFTRRNSGVAMAAASVSSMCFLLTPVFLPLYMVHALKISVADTGVTLIALSIGIVVGSGLAGAMSVRVGRCRPALIAGLLVLLAAFGTIAFGISPHTTRGTLAGILFMIGLGVGPSLPLFTVVIQKSVEREHLGMATSALGFSRSCGQIVGLAILSTIFNSSLVADLGAYGIASLSTVSPGTVSDPVVKEALTSALALLYKVALVIVSLGIGLTLCMPDVRLGKAAQTQGG